MNTFQVTNSVTKAQINIRNVQPGRIFFYGGNAFIKLVEPFPAESKCMDCGRSHWNVHNFSNAVHFCDSKTYPLELTEFQITPELKLKTS